jgi:HTH-type transcriptional regulator/antitoxin HigA
MTRIENEEQYNWAVARVEQLLPLVTDDTPRNDPNSIELDLLSNLVADYSDEHFSIGRPSALSIINEMMASNKIVEPVF